MLAEWLDARLPLVGMNAWGATFLLLAMLHAVMVVTVMRLPGRT